MEEDIIRSSVLYPQRKRKKETEKVVCSSKNLDNLDSEFPRAVQVCCFYIPVYHISSPDC